MSVFCDTIFLSLRHPSETAWRSEQFTVLHMQVYARHGFRLVTVLFGGKYDIFVFVCHVSVVTVTSIEDSS